jgi:hypothetical protein
VIFSHPLIEIQLFAFFEESEPVVGILLIGHRVIQREALWHKVVWLFPHIWVPVDVVDGHDHVLALWHLKAAYNTGAPVQTPASCIF